jgi:hypothetical protein
MILFPECENSGGNMTRYREGDWVKFRHRGLTQEKKVLEVKPNGNLIVGSHDNDPSPIEIQPETVKETL